MTQRIDVWVESAGLGHVTRQINFFEHLRARPALREFKTRFLIDEKPATREALERAGHDFTVRDADVSKTFRSLAAEWSVSAPALFIMDSVAHDKEASSDLVLQHSGVPSAVFIDDTADRDVSCDLLVNALPSLSPPQEKTRARRAVRGPEYLVLPPEYVSARLAGSRRKFSECRTGFAFFGGADLENFTAIFVDTVAQLPLGIAWTLLIGPSYAHTDALLKMWGAPRNVPDGTGSPPTLPPPDPIPDASGARKSDGRAIVHNSLDENISERTARAASSRGGPIEIVRYVPSMATELASADIAVLAAGNTLSEAAAVGTPAIVFSQNPVQAENAHFFAQRAGVVDCGSLASDSALRLAEAISSLAADPHRRGEMSERMMATVDGEGGGRLAALIESLVLTER